MLQRPDYGTKGHILLWLGGKEGEFYWPDACECACGQYVREHNQCITPWTGALSELNDIGRQLFCDKYGFSRDEHLGYEGDRKRLISFCELETAARREWGL